MSSSPTETAGTRAGWRTVHLVLAALIGFLVLLASAATLFLSKAALMPSVRQLALPMMAVVDLIDTHKPADQAAVQKALQRGNIQRAPTPPDSQADVLLPFLETLVAYAQVESGREVRIEYRTDGGARLWFASVQGDWIGVPLEPMRSLVTRFAIWIAALALVLAMLAAWWLARRLAAPVEHLATIAARLPEPVDSAEFRVDGPREIRLLGDRLAQALARIETQRRERDLLLAGLSHDLRTPMMRLLLRLDLLDGLSEEERAALHAEIAELDRRIDRFIEHARTGAEEPYAEVELVSLLEAELDASTARGYAWTRRLPPFARVRGQPGVLARLLANLFDNAEQHGAAPFRAELALDGEAREWHLCIENTISPESRAEAGPAVMPHRGFGLTLCRHITQSHGGRLAHQWVSDRYRVDLYLPA